MRANGRGRISADSFRLLTAKLKKASPAEAPPPAEAPAAAIALVPAPAAAPPEQAPPEVADLAVAPEVVLGLSDPVEAPVPPFDEAPMEFVPPEEQRVETDPVAAAEPDVEVIEPPAPAVALPQFSPLSWTPAPITAPAADLPPVEALSAEIEPDIDPVFAAAEEAGPEDAAQAIHAEWVDEAHEEPAEPDPVPVLAEAAAAQEPPPAEAAEADYPLAGQSDAASAEAEHPATQEAPASELTGRVVDAMLKTISSAIYAKPSASERAAFLREIANLMEQDGAPAAPPPAPAPAAPVAGAAPVVARNVHLTPAPEAAAAPDAEADEIGEVLAGRLGPSAALLKAKPEGEDPFAEPPRPRLLEEPKLTETAEADEESGELALTLLDMMAGGAGSALPQERTLAADTLLRILPRIPVKQLLAVVERVAIMEAPPALLVAKLIRDSRPEVVGPLIERCSNISDQDLMNAAPSGDAMKLRMMARRRVLSQVLSDYLIASGEPNVVLTLIRNPGAALSHDAFYRLAELAAQHHALLAPLATRADLPPPVAFELFWHVPPELRRFIFSRFLTDSETLNRILRITLATHGGDSEQAQPETRFPPREEIDAAIDRAAEFRLDEAAQHLGTIAGIGRDTALRVLSDRDGEPVTVLLKALGYPRSGFDDVLARLRQPEASILRPDRKPEELQAVFDGLSFNKARILLTYWDWFVRKAGPYAPHN